MSILNFLKARLQESNSRNLAIVGVITALILWLFFPNFTNGFLLGSLISASVVIFLKPDAVAVKARLPRKIK